MTGLRTRYKWLNLASLCSGSPEKKIIYLNPADSLLLTYKDSPTHEIKCHLELRLPGSLTTEKFGFSVFMEEMKLETRTGRNKDCDSDFVQFGR